MIVQMDWKGGYKFAGTSLYGHELVTDGSKKSGGKEEGYQPLELLVFSLAGCTGIDVVMIAQKMRLNLTDMKIKVDARQRDEAPRLFTHAHIEYIFKGKDLDPKKLERAIQLSHEKYCSVSATIAGVTKLTHSLTIEEE